MKTFLHVLISEASKYNMCKFYQIASNSLQVIHLVHELFDCPSYMSITLYYGYVFADSYVSRGFQQFELRFGCVTLTIDSLIKRLFNELEHDKTYIMTYMYVK